MNDDLKQCPYCAETIKSAAIKCRFCGERQAGDGGTASSGAPGVTYAVDSRKLALWVGTGVAVLIVLVVGMQFWRTREETRRQRLAEWQRLEQVVQAWEGVAEAARLRRAEEFVQRLGPAKEMLNGLKDGDWKHLKHVSTMVWTDLLTAELIFAPMSVVWAEELQNPGAYMVRDPVKDLWVADPAYSTTEAQVINYSLAVKFGKLEKLVRNGRISNAEALPVLARTGQESVDAARETLEKAKPR